MEIIWTESALMQVEQIGRFIALDSPESAGQFIDKLIKSVERLAAFPYSSPVFPLHPAFRLHVFAGYRIIYRVVESKIEIVTVLAPRKNM